MIGPQKTLKASCPTKFVFWFKVADSSRGHSLIKFRLSSAAQQKSSGFGFKVYRPPGVEVRNIYGSFR